MLSYLLEIGVEELPASYVRSGLESLAAAAKQKLEALRLAPASLRALGTPRRLSLLIEVPDAQPNREETVTGPPWAVAFKDGEPTKAALGFAKKNGVDASALKKVETPKGDYVAADVREEGQPAADVLKSVLPEIIAKAHFRKAMRWGEGVHSFGRPIHWMISLLGDEVVPFEYAGVTAGRQTRGHRFLSPETFEIANVGEYEAKLAEASVIVDVAERTGAMNEGLEAAAKECGGVVVEDAFLVEENASMVEKPFVVPGTIDDEFLELPDEVVISVMRDHQRYFALRDDAGKLLPRYLNVVNTAKSPKTIAAGNDRVLRARLADARFFVQEDRKVKLESRLPKLDTVTFQKKLGSIGDKRRRIMALATKLAEGAGVDVTKAEEAAKLCKADLESLIVFEFPELQGQMGRFYALHEGIDGEVADAIAEHYMPAGASDAVAPSAIGAIVGLADRIDTLVGCFGIGQKPSSSADPFGLRRAALGVIRTALEGSLDVNLPELVAMAREVYGEQFSSEMDAELLTFFEARLRAIYKESHPGDLVDATLSAWGFETGLRDLDARMKAVAAFRSHDAFDTLAVAFKRAFNISKDIEGGPVDVSLFSEPAEKVLLETYEGIEEELAANLDAMRYDAALALIGERLRGPIDQYFDDVFVMSDDLAVRNNRLRQLKRICDRVTSIVHFHRLSS